MQRVKDCCRSRRCETMRDHGDGRHCDDRREMIGIRIKMCNEDHPTSANSLLLPRPTKCAIHQPESRSKVRSDQDEDRTLPNRGTSQWSNYCLPLTRVCATAVTRLQLPRSLTYVKQTVTTQSCFRRSDDEIIKSAINCFAMDRVGSKGFGEGDMKDEMDMRQWL